MTITRRTFLAGSVSGLTILAVSACTDPQPAPPPTVPPTSSRVPRPAAFERTDWMGDPLTRGSASFDAVGSTPEHRATLRTPVDDRVFLAGEHTAEIGAGTVQGARASGIRVADDISQIAEPGERIAIVGAGLAGVTAARLLDAAGFDVVVIEGRERAGGRILSLDDDRWPIPVELGAGVVHNAEANSVADALADAEIDTAPLAPTMEHRTRAGAVLEPDTVGERAVAQALDWAAMEPRDMSIEDALVDSGAAAVSSEADQLGVSPTDRLENHVLVGVSLANGAEADDLSAWFTQITPTLEEGDELVTGGFDGLLASELEGITVLPTSVVSAVTMTDRGVSLRLVRGESYSADRVVITVPLGVLQSDSITFDPPLPFSHRGAIAALGMGVIERLILRFDEPFWSTEATAWSVVDGDTDFPLWLNLMPATGHPILVGLMGGEAARRLSEYEDLELLEAALASLEPFLDPALVPPGGGDD